jgi:hypothetical protein
MSKLRGLEIQTDIKVEAGKNYLKNAPGKRKKISLVNVRCVMSPVLLDDDIKGCLTVLSCKTVS